MTYEALMLIGQACGWPIFLLPVTKLRVFAVEIITSTYLLYKVAFFAGAEAASLETGPEPFMQSAFGRRWVREGRFRHSLSYIKYHANMGLTFSCFYM